jgi:hypothetical protein
MSAPVRELDDGPSIDESLNYAPKRVRIVEPDPDLNPAGAPPEVDAAPQSAVRGSTEPPWRRSKQRAVFAGDVAITELRNKLALAPERLPEPPSVSTNPRYALPHRLTVVGVAAACGLIGFQWGSAPPSPRPQPALPSGQSNQQGFMSKRSVAFPLSLRSQHLRCPRSRTRPCCSPMDKNHAMRSARKLHITALPSAVRVFGSPPASSTNLSNSGSRAYPLTASITALLPSASLRLGSLCAG